MEVGQVLRIASPPMPYPDSGETYRLPVRCPGGICQALVNSGCTQTLVHQTLLEAEWVEVKCVHGDIHKYPSVQIEIRYQEIWNLVRRTEQCQAALVRVKKAPCG